jgi:hypothetical protein
MTALGFLGWVWLLRRGLGVRLSFAVLGGVLLSSMNALQYQVDIGKLVGFHLYPWLLLLLATCFEVRRGVGRWEAAIGFSALLGLFFFTSYYPAWHFLFSLLLIGVLYGGMVVTALGLRDAGDRAGKFLQLHWPVIGTVIGVFALALLPFIITYASLIASDTSRSYVLVLSFTPRVPDLINVSRLNLVWGHLLEGIGYQFGSREAQMGSPVLVLMLFSIAAAMQAARLLRGGFRPTTGVERFVLVLSAAAIVIAVITVKYHDLSAWYVVYSLVPGASALRAEGRYLIVFDMLVIVVVTYSMDRLWGWVSTRLGTAKSLAVTTVLGAVLILEQANGVRFRLDKSEELAFMARFPEPPTLCKAFYAEGAARDEGQPLGYYELDAMMIAMRSGIPTINGYSGIAPADAFTITPAGAEYRYKVMDWLKSRGSTRGVCELNMQTASFAPVDVEAAYTTNLNIFAHENLTTLSTLLEAARRFEAEGNDLGNLYPQYLAEHGYLSSMVGDNSGSDRHRTQSGFWLGTRPCGQQLCIGVGVTGKYKEMGGILAAYGDDAARIFFPDPEPWSSGSTYASDARGDLLLLFRITNP